MADSNPFGSGIPPRRSPDKPPGRSSTLPKTVDSLDCVTLNVWTEDLLYTRPEWKKYTFASRWHFIQTAIKGRDVIMLQEVHERSRNCIAEFAEANGYTMYSWLYHTIKKMYLVTLIGLRFKVLSVSVTETAVTDSKMLGVIVECNNRHIFMGNTHYPPDFKFTGSRMAATEAFIKTAACFENAFIAGDWNIFGLDAKCAPGSSVGFGDVAKAQLALAAELGDIAIWKHDDDDHTSTFYGGPQEKPEHQGYNAPSETDRCWSTKNIQVVNPQCKHLFYKEDGVDVPISDHFPCYFTIAPRVCFSFEK